MESSCSPLGVQIKHPANSHLVSAEKLETANTLAFHSNNIYPQNKRIVSNVNSTHDLSNMAEELPSLNKEKQKSKMIVLS